MPELSVLGTLVLGAGTLDLGWQIGRTIDTRWLHLSGDIGTNAVHTVSSYNAYARRWVWYGPGTTALSLYDIPDEVRASGFWALEFWMNQNSWEDWYSCSPVSMWGGCDYNTSYAGQALSAAAAAVPVGTTYDAAPYSNGGATFYQHIKVMTGKEMDAALIHDGSQVYTDQQVNRTTTIPSPTETATNLQAARDAITAAGTQVQSETDWALDPNNWVRPDTTTGQGGGAAFSWVAASPDETYDQYVARLRNLGWLGNASITTLGADGGDPSYVAAGVPCTSVPNGTTIGAYDSATFYQNPTSTFSSEHGSDGGSCGGGFATPPSDQECEFNDAISMNPNKGSWQATTEAWGPYALDAECTEAWQKMADLGVVDANGQPTTGAVDNAVGMVGLIIANPVLQSTLPQHGDSIEEWNKVYLQAFGGESFVTNAGYRFELHFYRDTSHHVYTGMDYKIVFKDWFH